MFVFSLLHLPFVLLWFILRRPEVTSPVHVSGSWICFSNLDRLSPAVVTVLASLLSTVMEGLRQGKTAVHLESEDIQLSASGACFALLDTAIPLKPYNPDKLLLFHSTMSELPETLLQQFRTVSMLQPDLQLTVQVLLLSQGTCRLFLNPQKVHYEFLFKKPVICVD